MGAFLIKIYILFCTFYTILSESENFKDVRTALSSECQIALNIFDKRLNLTNITDDEDIWAVKMFEASSKIPIGPVLYNFGDLGYFKECIEIKSKKDNIIGKYCLGEISVNTSIIDSQSTDIQKDLYISLNAKISDVSKIAAIPTKALCMPSNCSDTDAVTMMNSYRIKTKLITCQTLENVYPPLDRAAITGISILSFLSLLVIVSTTLDIYFIFTRRDQYPPICVAFSIYTNGKKLFSISRRTSNLSCLDGIRVLSMVWIILLHTLLFSTTGPILNSIDNLNFINSTISMIFVNGDMACDTFLMVGGTLVTYGFFKTKVIPKLTISSILKHYVHRYIRLTPALAGLVLVSATLLKYLGSGPKWPLINTSFQETCQENWWETLLYVQNFGNCFKMCVSQSWYLNVDMQLYILSPLIFFLLAKYPKTGILIILLGILSSITYTFAHAYEEMLPGIRTNLYSPTPTILYMTDYYFKTYTRAPPWLMGTILGYILTTKWCENAKVPKVFLISIWGIILGVIMICLFVGHVTLRGPHYRHIENALYIALLRPTFALCIGWIIWACATQHGGIINRFLSLPIFQFLNKFIYSIYLLHVTWMYMLIYSSKTSMYFDFFNLANWFWGVFIHMFILSIIWILVFESPMIALEKIIFSR